MWTLGITAMNYGITLINLVDFFGPLLERVKHEKN
jgi:hypothetical protein